MALPLPPDLYDIAPTAALLPILRPAVPRISTALKSEPTATALESARKVGSFVVVKSSSQSPVRRRRSGRALTDSVIATEAPKRMWIFPLFLQSLFRLSTLRPSTDRCTPRLFSPTWRDSDRRLLTIGSFASVEPSAPIQSASVGERRDPRETSWHTTQAV